MINKIKWSVKSFSVVDDYSVLAKFVELCTINNCQSIEISVERDGSVFLNANCKTMRIAPANQTFSIHKPMHRIITSCELSDLKRMLKYTMGEKSFTWDITTSAVCWGSQEFFKETMLYSAEGPDWQTKFEELYGIVESAVKRNPTTIDSDLASYIEDYENEQ